MGSEHKDKSPMPSPIEWVFRASMLLFGAAIALNLAVAYLQPVMPWLIGGMLIALVVWLVVAIARWRRSRW